MTAESTHSSLLWDSSSSVFQFQSSSFSNLEKSYDCSLVAPMTFSRRPRGSHASTILQLPPLKKRSTLTWNSSESTEKFHSKSGNTTEWELIQFKKNYDRVRASLSQTLEDNRYKSDKAQYRKTSCQQLVDARDELIEQLSATQSEIDGRLARLQREIVEQRRQRDNHEMRRLLLQRTFARLDKSKDQCTEVISSNDKAELIEEYDARIAQLKKEQKGEITHRDAEIKELKEQLCDQFDCRADEHTKLLRATERANHLENQKRNILQERVDDYEANVFRATKPCCLSTSYRLNKVLTQLRLYAIVEATLNDLFESCCSCGCFERAHRSFVRLHAK